MALLRNEWRTKKIRKTWLMFCIEIFLLLHFLHFLHTRRANIRIVQQPAANSASSKCICTEYSCTSLSQSGVRIYNWDLCGAAEEPIENLLFFPRLDRTFHFVSFFVFHSYLLSFHFIHRLCHEQEIQRRIRLRLVRVFSRWIFPLCEWADARVRGSIKIKTNVVRIDVRVAGIFAWHIACLSPTCAWLSSHEFFISAYNARIRKLFLFCSRIIIIYKNASHAYRRLPSSPQHRSATFTTYCSWSEVMESLVCPFLCHVLCQSIRSARDLDSQWYHASLTSTTSLSSIVMSTHHVMLDSGSSKNMNYCYLAESSVYFEWKSMKSLRSISVWICWIWNRIIKANVPNKENCIKSSKLTKFIIVCMREVSITWFLCLSIPGLLLPIPTTAFDHDCADAVVVARSRCECFVFYCYDYYCSFENYISSFYIVCGAILLGYSSCAMERESENFLAHFESMAVGCWFWADGCSALKRTICLAVTHKDSSVDIQWLPTIFATSTKLVDHFHSIWCRRIDDQRSATVSARHLFMFAKSLPTMLMLSCRMCVESAFTTFDLPLNWMNALEFEFHFSHSPLSLTLLLSHIQCLLFDVNSLLSVRMSLYALCIHSLHMHKISICSRPAFARAKCERDAHFSNTAGTH